jgi:predicted RNA binding protein YcfA (HicA-like mRNA interferase family)
MPSIHQKSAEVLIKELTKLGFIIKSQKGSHVKLYRKVDETSQILIIPNHKDLKTGTLHSIYKKCSDYLDKSDLEIVFDIKK